MGILKTVYPHVCDPPENPERKYSLGVVWECEVCGRQFRLRHTNQLDGYMWIKMEKKDYLPGKFRHTN